MARRKMQEQPSSPVLSPCTGVCTMHEGGYCLGCFRTASEIAAWPQMSAAQRLYLMDEVLPRRQRELGH